MTDEEALAPLKEGIKNGKMGSLTVDPESLEVKKNNKGNSSYKPHTIKYLLLLSYFSFFDQETTNFSTGSWRGKKKKKRKAPIFTCSYRVEQSMVDSTREIAIRYCFPTL